VCERVCQRPWICALRPVPPASGGARMRLRACVHRTTHPLTGRPHHPVRAGSEPAPHAPLSSLDRGRGSPVVTGEGEPRSPAGAACTAPKYRVHDCVHDASRPARNEHRAPRWGHRPLGARASRPLFTERHREAEGPVRAGQGAAGSLTSGTRRSRASPTPRCATTWPRGGGRACRSRRVDPPAGETPAVPGVPSWPAVYDRVHASVTRSTVSSPRPRRREPQVPTACPGSLSRQPVPACRDAGMPGCRDAGMPGCWDAGVPGRGLDHDHRTTLSRSTAALVTHQSVLYAGEKRARQQGIPNRRLPIAACSDRRPPWSTRHTAA
jgi:hypothetical protein